MLMKNDYNTKKQTVINNPVTNNMNTGTQVGRLTGKLNIAMKKEEDKKPEIGVIVIDGNATEEDMNIFDGNFLDS